MNQEVLTPQPVRRSAALMRNAIARRGGIHPTRSGLRKNFLFLSLSLQYILNGNHQPKKVQTVNLLLCAIFLAGGLWVSHELFSACFVFAGVALINWINWRMAKKLGQHQPLPEEGDIFTRMHSMMQRKGLS
ncbi:MAG TPA: hypothetical protein VMM58_03370 [Bacteroidota bacterium]|nr:hypothetical protein [Bacteroidota bacterium]